MNRRRTADGTTCHGNHENGDEMTTTTTRARESMAGITLAGVVLSLLMSGWALANTIDDEEQEQLVEQRLVCLELPGPNDCGADGR